MSFQSLEELFMSKLMTGVAGIRGIIGDGLSPEVIARYGAAFGTLMHGGKIVVGGDTRPSRHMVRSALFAGLSSTGCDIVDLGLATTPTIEIMVTQLEATGGVCVTASHNPIGWNALKFLDKFGHFLGPDAGAKVNDLVANGKFEYVGTQRLGKITTYDSAGDIHIQKVLETDLIDVPLIRRAQFRVAVDGINSVGNIVMPDLLHELGCDIVKINSDLSGIFAREAEPLPENLSDLCALVSDEGADIGLALDPDGDRLAIVDEQGSPIGEEYTLALAVKYVLSKRKGPVVVNLSSSRASEDIAEAAGVDFYRTPVGEAHVTEKMDQVSALIGGEGNGGVMFPEVHSGRDALVGAGLALSLLAEEGVPLSVLISRLPRYHLIKRKAPAGGVDRANLENMLRSEFADSGSYDNRDGVRVDLPEGWVHLRLSNTEPIVRIFAEARTNAEAEALSQRTINALEK